jgi:hypothetical protein
MRHEQWGYKPQANNLLRSACVSCISGSCASSWGQAGGVGAGLNATEPYQQALMYKRYRKERGSLMKHTYFLDAFFFYELLCPLSSCRYKHQLLSKKLFFSFRAVPAFTNSYVRGESSLSKLLFPISVVLQLRLTFPNDWWITKKFIFSFFIHVFF